MTSYLIYSPIAVFCFQTDNHITYHAWSPRRYGPTYTYDIVIEIDNNSHPIMNHEYPLFLQSIFDHLVIDHTSIHNTTRYGNWVSMHTDFHCSLPSSERGDHLYCIMLHRHIISPLFFNHDEAQHFINTYRNYLPLVHRDLKVVTIEHTVL